jgi:hypothetical protein
VYGRSDISFFMVVDRRMLGNSRFRAGLYCRPEKSCIYLRGVVVSPREDFACRPVFAIGGEGEMYTAAG